MDGHAEEGVAAVQEERKEDWEARASPQAPFATPLAVEKKAAAVAAEEALARPAESARVLLPLRFRSRDFLFRPFESVQK